MCTFKKFTKKTFVEFLVYFDNINCFLLFNLYYITLKIYKKVFNVMKNILFNLTTVYSKECRIILRKTMTCFLL